MTKYPIEIHVTHAGDALNVKVTTSLDKAIEGVTKLEKELRGIETDYSETLAAVAVALKKGRRARGSDPRAFWFAGKCLHEFLNRLETKGYYLVRKNHCMAAHLGMSRASVEKIVSFYLRYKDPTMLDLSIPWGRYRDNKE